MTAPNGAIKFNNSAGHDTQSSGLGPAVAVYGSGASTTAGSATVTGINTAGVSVGDLLWVQSSSGRQFSIIASINVNGTEVTCDDTFANTESGRTWAIGGKRATFDNADSRQCFTDSAGWTFETETDQSLTSTLVQGDFSAVHTIRGSSGSRKTITQTIDDQTIQGSRTFSAILKLENLKFDNTASTKVNAVALHIARGLVAVDCIFGDATNTLTSGLIRYADKPRWSINRCVIQHCTSIGWGQGGSNFGGCNVEGCLFLSNGSDAMQTGQNSCTVANSIFANNAGDGIAISNGSGGFFYKISNNIFYNNSDAGIGYIASNAIDPISQVVDNIFVNNNYGVDRINDVPEIYDYNAFYSNTTANYSDSTFAGANDITLTADPFVDAANGDFNLNNAAGGGAVLRSTSYTLGG